MGAIVALTLATAYIHVALGGLLFTLNSAGYLVLAAAVVLTAAAPHPVARRFVWLPRLGLAGYAGVTILAYLVLGPQFDSSTITVSAGQETTIFFRNLDGQPHNVAIYTDESASEPLWVGETITDDAITETIPPLEAGEAFFRCDLHPAMAGTVVVEG